MRSPSATPLGRIADALGWLSGVAAATAVVLLFTLDSGPAAAPDGAEAGRAVYEQRCAICHGDDGQGGTGPGLSGLDLRYPDPNAALAVVVTGRNAMPAFGDDLTGAEIEAVLDFVGDRFG